MTSAQVAIENSRTELLKVTSPVYESFISSTKDPKRYLDLAWKEILEASKWGKFWSGTNLAFDGVRRIGLPISEFRDYQPALEAAFDEKISPLTGQPIAWWARSSGTTNVNKKAFPYTEAVCKKLRIRRVLTIHNMLMRTNPLHPLKILTFSMTDPFYHPKTQLPISFGTAILRLSFDAEFGGLESVPQYAYSDDLKFKMLAPIYALASEVSAFLAVTPAPVLGFLNSIQNDKSTIAAYISGDLKLPPDAPPLKISPQRREFLLSYLRNTTQFKVTEIWPSLQLVYCWKTSSCQSFLNKIQPYLSDSLQVVHSNYGAIEGQFALASQSDVAGGPVNPLYGVTEFLRVGADLDSRNLVQSWELKEGIEYEIILSNVMGLLRYRLHDIIRCVGYFNKSPVIQFVQKEGNAIALGVLYLLESDITAALVRLNVTISGRWVFVPRQDFRGLELAFDDNSSQNSPTLCSRVDDILCDMNPSYKGWRKKGFLEPIAGRFIPPSHQFWQRFPSAHAQVKPLIISNRPVEE